MEQEFWKDIDGYNGKYQVSNLGRVKVVKTDMILPGQTTRDGYKSVTLSMNSQQKRFRIHRLVAMAFVDGYKPDLVVNHKDENKQNNRADNLEWITVTENLKYNGAEKRRVLLSKAVCKWKGLEVQMLDAGNNVIRTFDSVSEAASFIGLKQSRLLYIINQGQETNGYHWRFTGKDNRQKAIKKEIESPCEIECLEGEIWKPIEETVGVYEVSNLGRIRSISRIIGTNSVPGQIMKQTLRKGHPFVVLRDRPQHSIGRIVSRLVAFAFVDGYQKNYVVGHKNGDVADNRAENLKWVRKQPNCKKPHTGSDPL